MALDTADLTALQAELTMLWTELIALEMIDWIDDHVLDTVLAIALNTLLISDKIAFQIALIVAWIADMIDVIAD